MCASQVVQLLLAAGQQRFSTTRFRDTEANANLQGFFAVLGVLAFFGLAAWFVVQMSNWFKNRTVDSPQKLFRELCRAHRLGRNDRVLLEEIAGWWGLSDPVQLFFEPERFRSPRMHEALDCQSSAEDLGQRLFARSER